MEESLESYAVNNVINVIEEDVNKPILYILNRIGLIV